jgi:hypothetical protein
MLVVERRRALWSLAIGLVAAVSLAAWNELEARHSDERVRAIIAKCEAAPGIPKGHERICDPNDFTPANWEELTGELKDVSDARKQAQDLRDNWVFDPVITFAIFCAPLLWYLILDRIREVSAAVSGRDQKN